MIWVIVALGLALLFGLLGLLINVLKWMLILALILFVVGAVAGFRKGR